MFSSTSDFTTIARPAYLALALALHSTLPQTAFGQTLIEQSPAQEQIATEQKPKWEFLVASGALIPTGPRRGAIKRANLTAAQLSYVVRSHFAVNATFGWARSGDVAAGGAPKLDIFTYDLGGEVRPAQWMAGHGVTFSPLAGLGAGARSYVSRNNDVDATHQFTPYVSAGGEFGFRRGVRHVHVRIEMRDYLSGFTGQRTGGTRNDIVALVGLRLTRQKN